MSQDVKPTRRAMLAGAVALAPATAIAAVPIGEDAELLRLGAELDRILPETLDLNWRRIQEQAAMESHLRQFLGGDDDTFEAEVEKWWKEHPEQGQAAESLLHRADQIAETILSIQPRTLAGLAVLTRAAAVLNPTLWHNDDDDDFQLDNRALKRLIEATCDLAGMRIRRGLSDLH